MSQTSDPSIPGPSGSGAPPKTADEAMAELTELLNMSNAKKGNYKYMDGWNPDNLEEELKQHPFFMTQLPKEGEPIPPLIEAFQQLKYSPDENSPEELAANYKEDGHFHFKLKKYRIAISCYTEAIRNAESIANSSPDPILKAQLYNNRAACQYRIENYGSALKDCEKSMKLKHDYFKPVLKAIECCIKLEKWDKVLELSKIADSIENDHPDVKKLRSLAQKNKTAADAKVRKAKVLQKKHDEKKANMVQLLRDRQIKFKTDAFLSDDSMEGKMVKVGEDGRLEWPVLFFYPQYSQSDYIETFHEDTTFTDHLTEILENDRPHWDADNEYHVNLIDVYFTDLANPEYIKVDVGMSLLNAMQSKRYVLPQNGVPAFIILASANAECQLILSRMKSS